MLTKLITFFSNNMVFAGLIMTMFVGTITYLIKATPQAIWTLILKQFSVSVVVENEDPQFRWITNWLSKSKYVMRARNLKLSDGKNVNWSLAPSYGTHFFWHNGLVILRRQLSDKESLGIQRKESMTITVLGRKQDRIRRLIQEAYEQQHSKEHVNLTINGYGYWQYLNEKKKRSFDSVFLPPDQKQDIIKDAKWFFGAEKWYEEHGIPFRRGYLLYGPPGTGKSTIALTLASHFDKPICYLNLRNVGSDNDLLMLLAHLRKDAIVLIEDVDAVLGNREEIKTTAPKTDEKKADEPKITMSGVLNALDGLPASDNRLLIMTTNHIDKLDAALIRAGRIDKRWKIDHMVAEQVVEMFNAFFPGHESKNGIIKVYAEEHVGTSPADYQCLFMSCNSDVSKLMEKIGGSAKRIDVVIPPAINMKPEQMVVV